MIPDKLPGTATNSSRLKYLDIAKGLLIISVVVGHTHLNWTNIIYWFHLPSFFIISGLLHKQPEKENIKPFIWKKTVNLMRPYLAFGLCVVFIMAVSHWYLQNVNPFKDFAMLVARLLFSGRLLFWTIGPFWFIPTLLLTIISFTLLCFLTRKRSVALIALFLSFIIGISLGKMENIFIPWNGNVVFFSMFYYGLGYYSKDVVRKFYEDPRRTLYTGLLLVACSALIYLSVSGYYEFNLDMKISLYSNPVLAVIYPIIFTLLIIGLSIETGKSSFGNAFAYIGINSLIIMYLHYPVNNGISTILGYEYSPILFIIIGVLSPLVIGFLIEKNSFTNKLFFGRSSMKTRPVPEFNKVGVLN